MRDVAQHLIERVGQIQPSNMPISGPPEVVGVDVMGFYITHLGWTNEKAIGIVMLPIGILCSSIITIIMKAELRRIPLPNEVLPVEVCDHNLPMPNPQRV